MTQFDVHRIGPEIKVGAFDISFTNASLFMIISSVAILLIFNNLSASTVNRVAVKVLDKLKPRFPPKIDVTFTIFGFAIF